MWEIGFLKKKITRQRQELVKTAVFFFKFRLAKPPPASGKAAVHKEKDEVF